MARLSKVAAFGLIIVAIVLVFGSKDGARATPAPDAHGRSAAQAIYPAGGSDGPP
jgi:hypothetical protein